MAVGLFGMSVLASGPHADLGKAIAPRAQKQTGTSSCSSCSSGCGGGSDGGGGGCGGCGGGD